jgi:large repetitive protein
MNRLLTLCALFASTTVFAQLTPPAGTVTAIPASSKLDANGDGTLDRAEVGPNAHAGFCALWAKQREAEDGLVSTTVQAIDLIDDATPATPATRSNSLRELVPVADVYNGTVDGAHVPNFKMPWTAGCSTGGGDLGGTRFAVRMRGNLHITDPGTYTFAINSDDGYSLKIGGATVSQYDANRGPSGDTRRASFSEGGVYPIEIVYWDQGGIALIEVFLANSEICFSGDTQGLCSTAGFGDRSSGGSFTSLPGFEILNNSRVAPASWAGAPDTCAGNIGQPNATCGPPLSVSCGNGIVDVFSDAGGGVGGAEGCDDGNTANGDGCSATCTVEPNYDCGPPQVSICLPVTPVITSPTAVTYIMNGAIPISGTGAPGLTVSVREGAVVVCSAVVANDGTWTCTPSPALTEGQHVLFANEVDAGGRVSRSSDFIVINVDNAAPLAPVILAPALNAEVPPNPSISGSGETGSTVTVREGMTVVCTAVVPDSGNWSCPSTLGAGPHSVTASQTDRAGNASPATAPQPFVVTIAPVITISTPATINAANAAAFPVSGTCTSPYPVMLSVGGVAVVAACTNGAFSTTVNVSGIPDGDPVAISASQTNASGTGAATASTRKETVAPDSPIINAPAEGSRSLSNMPTISGTSTAEAGSTITVREGSTLLCSAVVQAGGSWSCSSAMLAEGPHTIVAIATDLAGNPSGPSMSNTFTVDSGAPVAPMLTAPANGLVTRNQRPTFTALASPSEAGGTGQFRDAAGMVICSATVQSDGSFSCQPDGNLAAGAYTVTARVIDQTANVGADSNSNAFTIDIAAPLTPVIGAPTAGAEVATNPTIAGTGEAGATVTVKEGDTIVCTATVSSTGTWSCATALGTGAHTVTATQTDAAGNTSLVSDPRTFTVSAAPSLVLSAPPAINPANASTYPVSGTCATGVSVNITVGTAPNTATATAPCTAGMFSTTVNVTGVPDSTMVPVTASQMNAGGTAESTKNTSKDTAALAPVITAPAPNSMVAENPTISGIGEPGATVTVREGAALVCMATVLATGDWSCPTTLGLGAHTVIATQVDSAGNISMPSPSDTFTVVAASTVTVSAPAVINAGNAAAYPVAGTCSSAAGSVTVIIGGITKTVPCTNGAYSTTVDVSAIPDVNPIDVTASQSNGIGTSSDTKPTSKDTQVGPPVFTSPRNGSTVNPNPTLTGTAEPGATVVVKEGATVICMATANAAGVFTCPSALPAGPHSLSAIQTDTAGNVSAPGTTVFIVGTQAVPVVTLGTLTPVNAANVATYPVSGMCDTSAGMVTIAIESVTTTVACLNGQFMTNVNLTTIRDVAPLLVKASQTNANGTGSDTKATRKDTAIAIPVIASPSAASTVAPGPRLSGTAEPGATVVVKEGTTVICNATADSAGNWTCPSTLGAGPHSITATQTDTAGNVSGTSPVRMFTVGAVPNVTINDPANVDSTNRAAYPVSGTCDTSAGTVTVSVEAVSTTTMCINGRYTAALNLSTIPDGSAVLTASQTNAVGTGTQSRPIRIDSTAMAPTIVSPAEGSTVARNPTISGLGEPGAIVTIREGTTVVCVATADSTGRYSCNSSLMNGPHQLTATQVDGFGNVSPASPIRKFTIANVPAVTLNPSAPISGTNAGMYPVSGSCDASAGTVTITVGTVSTMVPCTGGMFTATVNVSALPDGMVAVSAAQTNTSGTGTATQMTSKDSTAPMSPLVTSPANGSSSAETKPTYAGTAEPGSTLTVIVDGASVGTAMADASGNWTLVSPTSLTPGIHTVSATAQDAAGNVSAPSIDNTFTVTGTGPMVSVTSPKEGSTVNPGSGVTVTGRAPAGQVVTITVDGVKVGQTTADTNGNFTFEIAASNLPEGSHAIEAASGAAKASVQIQVKYDYYLGGGGCSASLAAPLLGLASLLLRRRKNRSQSQ